MRVSLDNAMPSENGPELVVSNMTLRQIFRGAPIYDFAHQPPHPRDWMPIVSRDLQDGEVHDLADWLWSFCEGRWSVVTHYTPALRQLVYFEQVSDAVGFKLSWS